MVKGQVYHKITNINWTQGTSSCVPFAHYITLHEFSAEKKKFFFIATFKGQMDSLECHFDWNRVSTMSTFNTVRDIQSLRKSALAHLITINGRSGFFFTTL